MIPTCHSLSTPTDSSSSCTPPSHRDQLQQRQRIGERVIHDAPRRGNHVFDHRTQRNHNRRVQTHNSHVSQRAQPLINELYTLAPSRFAVRVSP